MAYRLVYTKRAERDIAKFDPQVRQRVKEALERYAASPLHYARKLANPALGSFRFRVGDYRIVFDIDGDDLVILRVGHRRDIYRP